MTNLIMSKAEIARQLGVSRTYVTLLTQGKRKPSKRIADKLAQLKLTSNLEVNLCAFEHLTFNQGVAGSRPARPTFNSLPLF
jgi:transcriptional regulator with XRE-family HTH domain